MEFICYNGTPVSLLKARLIDWYNIINLDWYNIINMINLTVALRKIEEERKEIINK